MTAFDGTVINAARVLRCVALATGMTLEATAASWGSRWAAFIQGDDTIIGAPAGFIDFDKYEEASAALGYKTKLIDGCVFLMHLIDPSTGRFSPLASRVFQQTVFNEYGGRHPSVELFSYMARATPGFIANNPWATRVEEMIKDGECFTRYGVIPVNFRAALRDPVFMEDLQRELLTTPNAADRFKDVSRSGLSDAVSALLTNADEVELPTVTAEEAWDAAQRVAAFMAIPAEQRTSTLPQLPLPLQDYYNRITQGETHVAGPAED